MVVNFTTWGTILNHYEMVQYLKKLTLIYDFYKYWAILVTKLFFTSLKHVLLIFGNFFVGGVGDPGQCALDKYVVMILDMN